MSQILLLNRRGRTNDSVATADSVKWDESKHPRKHGQFAPKGSGTTGKTGGKSDMKKPASSSGSVGWHKWLTSKEDSDTKAGGARGSRPAQLTAKWLKSNGKSVTDKQFSAIFRLVDRWGKTPSAAYKEIVGNGGGKTNSGEASSMKSLKKEAAKSGWTPSLIKEANKLLSKAIVAGKEIHCPKGLKVKNDGFNYGFVKA